MLFNYKISSYIRNYSFKGYLVLLLFDSNCEYFSFILARNSNLFFWETWTDKLFGIGVILFGFVFLLWGIFGFLCLYLLYGKLSKYFLENMFRFKSSIVFMTLCYAIRPMLKGFIHAFLYENGNTQLILLMTVELAFLLLMVFGQMKY